MSIFRHVKTKQCLKMGDAGHSYNGTSVTFEDCNQIMGHMDIIDDDKYYLKNESKTACVVPEKIDYVPTSLQSAYEMMTDADTESIDMAVFGNKVRDLATTEYGLNNNNRNSNKIWKAANNLGNVGTAENWNALKQAFVDLDFAVVDGVRSYNTNAIMGECDEDGLFQVYTEKENTDTPIKEMDVMLMFHDNQSGSINGNKKLWSHAMEYPGGHIPENIVGELGYAPYVIQRHSYLRKETVGSINWCVKRCPAYIMSGEYFIGKMDRELGCGRSESNRHRDTFKIIVENREDNNNTKKMRIMRTDFWNNGWGMRIIVNFPIDLSIYRTMYQTSPEPNERYSFMKGGPCTNDWNTVMNKAMAMHRSGCVAIGQQSNGCWHYLKKNSKGKTMAEHTCGAYIRGWEMVPDANYNQSIKYAYLGCYHDRPTRALNAYHGRVGGVSPEREIQWCARRTKSHGDKYYGDKYFGLQDPRSNSAQCFSGHSIHRGTKYGKKDCGSRGSAWGNAIYALFPSSGDKLETNGYFTFYDIEETISEQQILMNKSVTITCKIKYIVEAKNKDEIMVGKSIYYLIHHDDGKMNKLFFSPMEPESKKDEKFIVDITPGYMDTYDNKQGREGQHKLNFSITTISTKDGFKALVNTDIVPDGIALSKTSSTNLRTIPINNSVIPFKLLYHYPKMPNQTLINVSSFVNPYKKIKQTNNKLITSNQKDSTQNSDYIFKLAVQEEGFTERFTLDQDEMGPVYSMGKVGDWPWGPCPGFKDQNAEWIWHTAGIYAKNGSSGLLIYEYDNITGSPIEGRINIIVDNYAKVHVNGDHVWEGGGGWRGPGRTSAPFTLNLGKNLIMVEATNGGGPAGLLMTCYNTATNIKLFSTNMNGGWKSISTEG